MSTRQSTQSHVPAGQRLMLWSVCLGGLLATLSPGCTALHPIRGVPASYLPDQFIGPSRDNQRTIDLSLLVRTPPDQYRVAAGDVLSIYIPRVLGSQSTEVSSVGIEPPINMPASIEDPPTVGYPIQVRDDNTIPLPQISPLPVGGLTLHEVEMAIRKAYTVDHRILNPDEAMVLVSLQRPRIHRVLVVRQEANTTLTASSQPGSVNIGTTGKGTARVVTLKAYENDVLHALSQGDGVDGLPGLNAENVIYVIRRRPQALNPHCPPGPTAPHSAPVLDQNGYPLIGPLGANQAQPVERQYGQIQQTSFDQLAAAQQYPGNPASQENTQTPANPQPFASYRGSYDANRGFPTSNQNGPVQPTPYHSAQNSSGQHHPVAQTQYSPVPEGTYPQGGYPPNGYPPAGYAEPSPQFPAPYGAAPLPVDAGGHSMGTLAPIPEPRPSMQNQSWQSMLADFDPTIDNPNIIRIPVRLSPGENPNITEESITLHDGDIVFIDSRETEVFYTAGLLGGGQYMLPRDYDLGVLEAVSIAESRTGGGGGSQTRSVGGVSALNHDVSNSASRLAILRTLPNGKRITIEVDLRRAMRYQEENIRIQPGDILFLQYTFPEAVCAFTQRFILEGALFSLAASQFQSNR